MGTVHRIAPPKPVPAEGGLPAGLTIHEQGEVPKRTGARNVLDAAAMCDERDCAVLLVLSALCIKPTGVAVANLPSRAEWARLPETRRLELIGDWLRAEAFELMDFTEFSKPEGMTLGD